MDERLRRYLAQQIELGGAELVIGEGGTPRARKGPPVEAASDPVPEENPATAIAPELPSGSTTKRDWRVGAPPIPGAGLTIDSDPSSTLDRPEWDSLDAVARDIATCTRCFLARGRTQTVPGEGNPAAKLLLCGEGPGQTEDQTGRPFVGKAGELLTEILAAIGFARDAVFICNVVKCRPPQNRKPLPDEMSACSGYLDAQIALVRPKTILALGATAAEALLRTKRSLADLRGRVHSYRGIPLVVTYHPAALLRNPHWKKPTWDDVRIARQLVDR